MFDKGARRWCGNGFTVRTSFVWHIHDWIRNIPFTRINCLYTVLEEIRRWYCRCFIKAGSVSYILSVLDSSDVNIKFIYELQHEGKLPFLNVLLCRTERRFIQQFREKLPTMMYIWTGMHLHQLAGKEVHLRHL